MTDEVISPYLGDPDRDLLSGLTTAAAGLVSRVYQKGGGGGEEKRSNSSRVTPAASESSSKKSATPGVGRGGGGGSPAPAPAPAVPQRRGLPGERPGPSLRPVAKNGVVTPAPSNTSTRTATTEEVNDLAGSDSNTSNVSDGHGSSQKHSLLFLALIFLFSALVVFWVYKTFPNLEPGEKQYIKLPRNIEDAKRLGDVLNRYKEKYYWNVLIGVFVIYIFLQTFAIPGSIFLSILSGFLFPFWLALLLVCFCSAAGASFCYGLSWLVGRRLIYKYWPERVEAWALTVNNHRDNLFWYMIFLRVTPFLPNWFINITAPVIGVPIIPFFVGTFFGVAGPSFVAIHAGTTLHQLSSSSDAITWTSLFMLLGMGLLALFPVLMKDRFKNKFQ